MREGKEVRRVARSDAIETVKRWLERGEWWI